MSRLRALEKSALRMRGAGLIALALGVASVLAVLFALGRFLAASQGTASAFQPILLWELGRWYVWVCLVLLVVLASIALVAARYAVRYRHRLSERDQRATALQAQLDRAELELLGLRIRPHFLFNTLNAVSGLMHDDVDAADEMLTALGDLLRSALAAGGAQEIPLREEVDSMRRYLAIMRLRFGDRLTTSMELDAGVMDTLVPNLVLQPLVENAVRYGASRPTGAVHVEVRAERCANGVRLRVIDNGPGLPSSRDGRRRDGIGLRTTRARLRQTYGTAFRLELANRPPPNGGVEVELVVPFRPDVRRRVS